MSKFKCDSPDCESWHCIPKRICPVYKATMDTSLRAWKVLWNNLSWADEKFIGFRIHLHELHKKENCDIYNVKC